jgi:hypothetical protein
VSNALAIAAVSAVIKNVLDTGLIADKASDALGQNVTVSVLAPDAIVLANDAQPRLNLFMHQATPNAAWRNVNLPTTDGAGRRIANAPLALDLHYLLTAYGSADLQAELLLGFAMQLLHETPVLARNAIRAALNPATPSPNSIYQALRASDLADQLEQIKITPGKMDTEELSKLWTALQAHYRPTAPYLVTVVLIEATRPARSPLPVLSRGYIDPVTNIEPGVKVRPNLVPPFPEIETITLPPGRIAALPLDTIELDGHDLDGSNPTLVLTNHKLDITRTVSPPTGATATAVSFVLPDDAANYPAGVYGARLDVLRPGEPAVRSSNEVALALAPQIVSIAKSVDANGNLVVTPTCKPDIQPHQQVSLILGSVEVPAQPFSVATPSPSFIFGALPNGTYRARLRVDGVESSIVRRVPEPPAFEGPTVSLP